MVNSNTVIIKKIVLTSFRYGASDQEEMMSNPALFIAETEWNKPNHRLFQKLFLSVNGSLKSSIKKLCPSTDKISVS